MTATCDPEWCRRCDVDSPSATCVHCRETAMIALIDAMTQKRKGKNAFIERNGVRIYV